uniref:Cytohesin-interacting protein isoform X3 n=1 Tax=Pogona vitticeps TaxID=103695 RepID=A0ABM5F0W0_9SAUR
MSLKRLIQQNRNANCVGYRGSATHGPCLEPISSSPPLDNRRMQTFINSMETLSRDYKKLALSRTSSSADCSGPLRKSLKILKADNETFGFDFQEGEKENLPWRTAHSERGACEGVGPSVPSPEEESPKDASGCTEGILVEIESEEELQRRPTEVCLVDEGGAEMDLIMWEEVKGEGDFAREFSWLGEGELGRCTTRGVQTDWLKDAKSLADGSPGAQSLPEGGGLLPEPPITCGRGRTYEPLEWRVSVFPVGYHGGGRRVIRPGPEFQQKPLEGDWARHPCCGTICAVRSAPLRTPTDRERFGPAPW